MIVRFRKISDNAYRGGAPSIEDVIFLNKMFNIKKIISLDFSSGKHIQRACKLLGIKQLIIPLEIYSKASVLKLLSYDLEKLLTEDGPIFIHCIQGKDRTGFLSAIYRVLINKWSPEKAISEAKSIGMGTHLKPQLTKFYCNLIKQIAKHHQDINSADDIVSNVREMSGDITLDNLEQQSWSPYTDYRIKNFPDNNIYLEYPEMYDNRQDMTNDNVSERLGKPITENTIPQSGIYDQNTQGINGAGPSMIGSGIMP